MVAVTLPIKLKMLVILDFCHQTHKLGWHKTLWSTSQTFLWKKGHGIAVNWFVLELQDWSRKIHTSEHVLICLLYILSCVCLLFKPKRHMPSVTLPSDVTFAVVSAKFVILQKKKEILSTSCVFHKTIIMLLILKLNRSVSSEIKKSFKFFKLLFLVKN